MEIEKLAIEGVWIGRSPIHTDERGHFREWFKLNDIASKTGREFDVVQSNVSMSHRGVLRGIHYSLAAKGQGKWIACVSGSIWDVVVDIRPSSPTYKKWIGTQLDGDRGEAIFISEGLGHGFISLEDNSIVSYMLTSPYSPRDEFEIYPFDSELEIDWLLATPLLSPKDLAAPSLATRLAEGKLPDIN